MSRSCSKAHQRYVRARDACSPRIVEGLESPQPALCQPNQMVRPYSAPSTARLYDPAQAPPALWYCPAALEERERRSLAAQHMEQKRLGQLGPDFMPKLETVLGFTFGPQAAGIIGIPGWEGVIASSRYNDTKPPSSPTFGESREARSAGERPLHRLAMRNGNGTAEKLPLHPCVLLDEALAARMAKARTKLYGAHTNVRKLYGGFAHGARDSSRPTQRSGGCAMAKSERPAPSASPRPV
eukprot:3859876-Prymnesium_polylepis.1